MSSQSMEALQLQEPAPLLQYRQRDFLMIRKETQAFCKDISEACVFRVIESRIEAARRSWIEHARQLIEAGKAAPKPPRDWWVTVTYEQIKEALYEYVDDIKTVMKRVKNMLKNKVLRRRADRANPSGAPQYTINSAAVQRKIDAWSKARPPKNGGHAKAGQEPGQHGFDEGKNENFAKNVTNRPPKNGGHAKQGQEPDEAYFDEEKNGSDLQKTEVDGAKNRSGRPPKNGYIEDNRKITSNTYKKDKDSALARSHSSSFPLLSLRVDYEALRAAPWCEETILALASKKLDVPDGDAIQASGDEAAIGQWYADWYKHAEDLLKKTGELSPGQAWQRIDRVIRYMATPGSPSWWQHRKTQSPITLKNVANNFHLQFSDAVQRGWFPLPTDVTLYDGPSYEAGYSGCATGYASAASAASPDREEVVAAMPPIVAEELATKTQIVHPEHSFLLLDDALSPTTLTVFMTSKEYESELEDDRRARIAQEVKYDLEQRGHHVEYRWQREQEHKTVEDLESLGSEEPHTDKVSAAIIPFPTPADAPPMVAQQPEPIAPPVDDRGAIAVRRAPRPALQGLSVDEINDFANDLWQISPTLDLHARELDDGSYRLRVAYGPAERERFTLRSINDWLRPAPCNEPLIKRAIAYGEELASTSHESERKP